MSDCSRFLHKIYLKEPDVVFIPNQGRFMIVSKTYYDRVGEDKFVKEPVGTGPYRTVRHSPGEYVDIERFEDYWSEKPTVKEALPPIVSTSTSG